MVIMFVLQEVSMWNNYPHYSIIVIDWSQGSFNADLSAVSNEQNSTNILVSF